MVAKKVLEFSCETPEYAGSEMAIYAVKGNLYGSSEAYRFQDDVRQKIAAGTKKIVINFAEAEKIDSCGIGILASVMWSTSQAGGGMIMVSVPEQVEKLLAMVMLTDRIDRADSCEEAIAKLAAL